MKLQKERINIPTAASIRYVFAGGISKVFGILSTPLFVRLLSPSDFGSYAFYSSLVAILCAANSPLYSQSVLCKSSENECGKRSCPSIGVYFPIFLFCSVICILLFTFMKVLSLNRQLVILLSLQTLFDSTIFLYLSVARFY